MSAPTSPPEWVAHYAALAGLLGTCGAALFAGWKGWSGKAKEPIAAPAALIAGDIMSTKPMADLAHEVGHLHDAVRDLSEGQTRTIDAINRLHDAERSTETALRDLCRTIERKL